MGPARRKITVRRLGLLLAGLVLAALPAVAATAHESPQRGPASRSETSPPGETSPQGEANARSYEALLERIKRGDSTVDFGALRQALAESPAYRPYDPDAERLRKEMFAAYAAEDYEAANDRARRLLEADYLDIRGHMVKALIEKRLGNTELARFHQFMAVSLLRSILDSGDGRSPETAYVVIAMAEEYAVLDLLGLRASDQALIRANGHSLDRMRAVGRDGDAVTLYFNVDLPIAWLERSPPR